MQLRDPGLAKHIRSTQFRDLRRTGMCYFAELGVPIQWIASISGHSIDYTQKILDTYIPSNTRFAVMGVAEAITRAANVAIQKTTVARATEITSHRIPKIPLTP